MVSLTLYHHPLSSFCHKALIALYENDIGFERRIIYLSDRSTDDNAELDCRSKLQHGRLRRGAGTLLREHARAVYR